MTPKENLQPTLIPLTTQIYPELNLEKWAIWKPSKSPHKELRTQILERTVTLADGNHSTLRVEVGFSDRGILTTEDRKTYYALIKLWEDHGRSPGAVTFSLRNLAKILEKTWGTNVIDALTQSLLRLRFTPFIWKNSYHNAQTGEREQLLTAFNILADIKISSKEQDGHITKAEGYFRFNDHILNNLLQRYTRPLYLTTLLKFKTEIAQLLYPYVDMMLSEKRRYERKSVGLFQDLGLDAKAYRKLSIRRQKLEPALQELVNVPLCSGILIEAKIEPLKDESDFKVVFRKKATSDKVNTDGSVDVSECPPVKPDTDKHPDAYKVVRYFHQRCGRLDQRPNRKELQQATALLSRYDYSCVMAIIDYAVKAAAETNFAMQWFGAILQYEALAVTAYQRAQQTVVEAASQLELKLCNAHQATPSRAELDCQFADLDAIAQTRLLARAETRLSPYKAQMTPEAYQETIMITMRQIFVEELDLSACDDPSTVPGP